MISIIDYQMGNPLSIKNMLSYLEIDSLITRDPEVIKKSDRLILPGVGSFDEAMKNLKELKLRDLLDELVLEQKIPILGICLGMQLLTNSSEEGKLPGLGWIEATTKRFYLPKEFKIPHMGWNYVKENSKSKLTSGLKENSRFYFVHSYYVEANNPKESSLKTTHYQEFDSAIEKDNIYGVQFHPEKSHKFGMRLLSNFSKV